MNADTPQTRRRSWRFTVAWNPRSRRTRIRATQMTVPTIALTPPVRQMMTAVKVAMKPGPEAVYRTVVDAVKGTGFGSTPRSRYSARSDAEPTLRADGAHPAASLVPAPARRTSTRRGGERPR